MVDEREMQTWLMHDLCENGRYKDDVNMVDALLWFGCFLYVCNDSKTSRSTYESLF